MNRVQDEGGALGHLAAAGRAVQAEQAATEAALESLQTEMASLKVSMQTQQWMASSNLTEVLSKMKSTNNAFAVHAEELTALKNAHQATLTELVDLKSFNKHPVQQLAAFHAREADDSFSQLSLDAVQASASFSKQYVPPSSASSVSGFDVVEADTE